mmetsp:Transcript_8731/g.16986  ORF Transcript_8731/g.16986 Transcript_8731/m.16986 type:complete len:796 (-) Transcript_8731:539-2926(-)
MLSFTQLLPLLMAVLALGDMYLHNPPGSNDRNRERKNNRNNGNRLFDSQNNGQGGYPFRGNPSGQGVPDAITYYHGSELNVEWTNQHACGANPNIHCEVVIQYACDNEAAETNSRYTTMKGLRDGYPTGYCYDSEDDNGDNGTPRCDATGTNTCTDAPQTGSSGPNFCQSGTHWTSRQFRSTHQNSASGTNTIPNPLQTGSTNLGGKTAAVRNAFYDAPTVDTSVTRDPGETDYGREFGMHENNLWYEKCAYTERNKGLYTADQKLKGNDARFTRQNPNGGRRGLECPEERDYYPYWRPNPWKDLAVLVSNISFCDYFTTNSNNVQTLGECLCPWLTGTVDNVNSAASGNKCPIDRVACADAGYQWREVDPPDYLSAPECLYHDFGRDNHLGNSLEADPLTGQPITPKRGEEPKTASYKLKIPEYMVGQCVLRLRYNMSTGDYNSHGYAENGGLNGVGTDKNGPVCPWRSDNTDCGGGASNNPDCVTTASGDIDDAGFTCGTDFNEVSVPLYNRPYVNLFNENTNSFTLGLAINTHQTGRTFQDRSYVFNVAPAPEGYQDARIVNLNVRGRRGNIVQSYPATEYDFTPVNLNLASSDYVHIQLHGSDFNDNRNANNGEGWQYSDRHNLVQSNNRGMSYPKHHQNIDMWATTDEAKKWAWVGQNPANCDPAVNDDDNQNAYKNCGKLNMSPQRFPQNPADGLVSFKKGTYYYYSTRNNNFSNRSHKAQIKVDQDSEGAKGKDENGKTVVASTAAVLGAGLLVLSAMVVMKHKGIGCFTGSSIGKGGMSGSAPNVGV